MTRRHCWITVLVLLLGSFATTGFARTLEQIRALGAISMCANPNALPYSSNQPDALPGFQVELGRAIAAELGLSLNVEWIVPRRRAKVVNCDMLFDRVNDSAVYEGRLLLSRPYHRSGIALALGRDAEALTDYTELKKGQKIGVIISSMASVVLGKAGKTTSPYAFESDMLEDLLKGELYGIATSSTAISYYIASNPATGLKIAYAFDSVPSLTWQVSVGLRNSDSLLLAQVNAVLDKLLANGTVTQIYQKYGIEHRQP
jgi:polar amino acid transport system substrate-binding protein